MTKKTLLNKKGGRFASRLLAIGLLACGAYSTQAVTWTGASPTSLLWNDPDNWSTLQAPLPTDTAVFANGGSTNQIGLVNNIVSVDTTVTNLAYTAKVSTISGANNYHTTQIEPGVTLRVDRESSGGLIVVGETTDSLSHDNKFFYTITGEGGALLAGNVSSPATNQGVQVTSVLRSPTEHVGSLDLSGLDNFTLAGGYLWVGINGGENTTTTDRPQGQVFLAKTNLIITAGTAYDTLNFGAIRVGESRGNTSAKASILELGQENTIQTTWLKIGGARTGVGTNLGGLMYFRAGLDNPSLKLRGSDGTNRMGTFRVGDNSWSTGSSAGSRGIVDLSGGTVDALIDTAFVGLGQNGTTTLLGGAVGELTWTDGLFDVNTFFLGYQPGNNAGMSLGTAHLKGANAKLSVGRLVMGRDSGNAAGGGVAVLKIDGGTVDVITYLQENNATAANVTSTVILTNNGVLNLQPDGDPLPAAAIVDTLDFSSGIITNGILALTNLNVISPATAFTVYPSSTLNAGVPGTVGTLKVNGGLALNGGTVSFDVASTASFDQITVGDLTLSGVNPLAINPLNPIAAGIYPLMSYTGTLVGDASNLQASGPIADSRYGVAFDTTAPNVTMNLSGSTASLSWSGGNNGNTWDLKTTTNWNSGTESFYTYDAVEFGDGGLASPAVNLVGTLLPGSITVSANQPYTFSGNGKISGMAGLTLNGSSTLTVLTTNDYTGGTTINSGTLSLGDGSTQGTLGTGPVVNYGTLVFNPAGGQTNANVISGSGAVIKRGSGLTRLSGANTFTGPLTVEAGTLQAGSTTALGDASLSGGFATILSGATLDIAGIALGTKPIIVSGEGVNSAGALINSVSPQFLRDVQFEGNTTIGGAAGITIASSSATSTDPGLTAYGYKLTKVALNHLKIDCLRATPWNLQLGDVDVSAGVLSFYGNLNLGSQTTAPITISSNAAVLFAHSAAFPLSKAIVMEDGSCVLGLGTASAIDGTIVLNGKGTFEVGNALSLTVNSPISGSGSLTKGIGIHPSVAATTGTGNLILSAANTFAGDLRIETGKVTLTNDASIANAANIVLAGGTLDVVGRTGSELTLAGGQSIKGSGSLIGSFSSPVGSAIEPRATNGLVAVTGNLTLRGTTTLDLNRSGATTNNSKITVTGTLDCGGSLVLTSSGEALRSGDTFVLFSAGTMLNPFQTASITWPALASGLYWDNQIAVNGSVVVAGSSEPATPPTVSATFSGNQLTLQWPAEYTSYILQGQTNAVGVGLTANWYNVTGTTNNQISISLDPAAGSVFYRLVKP